VRPYPVMMSLVARRVIVVGGGRVALRKVSSLLESGASVTVVSPELLEELGVLATDGTIEWFPEAFEEAHLDLHPDVALVFGTTNRRDVNVRIHAAAVARKLPCNIADVPDLCTFIVPAVITQGDLIIAVSTGGSSPALARRIREDLEKMYGPEYAAMTRMMGDLRKLVLGMGGSPDENKRLFKEIVESDLLAALRENDRGRAREILTTILPEAASAAEAMDNPQDLSGSRA
jgi:precorrin-2 dehydrogenase / sirohydrochlorin ferrochelatase